MNYQDAIIKISQDYGVSYFQDQFLTLAVLSDLVGNDFLAKKSIKILFNLIDYCDIYELLTTHNLKESRRILKNIYPNLNSLCTINEFIETINPISAVILPEEFITNRRNKNPQIRVKKPHSNHGNNSQQLPNNPKTNKVSTILNNNTQFINVININDVKSYRLKIKAKYCKIIAHNDPRFVIKKGNYDLTNTLITSNSLNAKGKLSLDIFYPFDNLEIYVPKRDYSSATIYLDNTECQIEGLKADNLHVKSNGKSLRVSAKSNKINVTCKDSFLTLWGRYKYVNVSGTNSTICFNVEPFATNFLSMDIFNSCGNITGCFGNKEPIPKIGKLIPHKKLEGASVIGTCLLDYHFETKKGVVNV